MYRSTLNKIFTMVFALISVFSGIGYLIGWLDVSAAFSVAGDIWLLSFVVVIFTTMYRVAFKNYSLLSKHTLTYILKESVSLYCVITGVGCTLIFLNVSTVEQGIEFVFILCLIMILLNFITFLIDLRLRKINENLAR